MLSTWRRCSQSTVFTTIIYMVLLDSIGIWVLFPLSQVVAAGEIHLGMWKERAMGDLDRRAFIKASGGALALVALPHCNDDGEPNGPTPGEYSAGNVSDYSSGDVRSFSERPFVVIRDDGGFYAMSAVCTHQGCTVAPSGSELACPCHGATFDLNGEVTGGPAPRALEHYEVTIDSSGAITVNTGHTVSASSRTQPS